MGTAGAVSVAGILLGIVAAGLLAVVALAVKLLPGFREVLAVMVGALVGTTVESMVAVHWPKDRAKHGHLMNLLNTGLGALAAVLLWGASLLVVGSD